MKRILLAAFTLIALTFASTDASAQKTTKKKEKVSLQASSTPSAEVAALKRPDNVKGKPAAKKRGDVYGSNYSDIIVDNWTGYYLDVYVDGTYRGSISPYGDKTTWAVPGRTTIYVKAVFSDGSYYWWKKVANTGYEYTLEIH